MDVTSLLNSSAARTEMERNDSTDNTPTPSATGGSTVSSTGFSTPSPDKTPSRRTSESRSSSSVRSRTPWDAGGYSLPLTLDTKSVQTPSTSRPIYYSESPIENMNSASPHSPKHKFSDSRSSLSSYASSSNNSVSHSRISSLSTVSEFLPLNSLTMSTDTPSLEVRMSEMAAPPGCPMLGEVLPPSPAPTRTKHEENEASSGSGHSLEGLGRAGSPSDAILITRPGGSSEAASPVNNRPDLGSLLSPDSSPSSRAHKRAVSAPDFPPITATTFPSLPALGDPNPVLFRSERRASYSTAPNGHPSSPMPTTAMEGPDAEIETPCMYIPNCDTGSQPRKAISHIFGRNKLCTRQIPKHVWVYYCRKHYQRSRYRNAQEYAKLQVDLVQKQVERIQAWSDDNKAKGKPGVVQDWSLSVRKREQKRQEDSQKVASRKRRLPHDEADSDDEFTMMSRQGTDMSGTTVPEWLRKKCQNGYTTQQIEDIVAELKDRMDSGEMTQIPDIEILPNISTDSTEESRGRSTTVKRRTAAPIGGGSAHRRTQSLQAHNLRPESHGMIRRISQPSFWPTQDNFRLSPVEKRQRVGGPEDAYGEPSPLIGFPNRNDRTIPVMGRPYQLPHRPSFSDIRENQAEDGYFGERPRGGFAAPYAFPLSGPHGPLPAPTAQRPGSQTMAQQLETATTMQTYNDPRRPLHQRSHSEIPAFSQLHQTAYRPTSSSGFPPANSAAYPSAMSSGYVPTTSMAFPPSIYATAPNAYTTSDPATTYGPTLTPQEPPPSYIEDTSPTYYDDYGRAAYPHTSTPSLVPQSALYPLSGQLPTSATPRQYAHARHQSTPAVPRQMGTPPTAASFLSTAAATAPKPESAYRGPTYAHTRHQSFAPPPPAARMVEDEFYRR